MERYDSYKDSGVEWIGEIPSHWGLIRTYLLTDNLDGRRVPLNSEQRGGMSGDIPYWGSGGIVDYIDKHIFDEELLLVGEDGSPFFDPGRDVSFYVKGRVWVNNHIHILRAKNERVNTKFLVYSFNSVDYKEYITGSTRDKLTQSDLNRILHSVPPVDEQERIVEYLDRKTALIDSLIEKTGRKIELLKEKRTSLINEVVTKGLDPDVEMKDSGVEWIGEIPRHWVVSRFKFHSEIITGNTPSKFREDDFYTTRSDGFVWVKPSSLNQGYKPVYESEEYLTEVGRQQTRVIPKGSIMVCSIGNTLGKFGVSGCEMSTNQQINSVVCNETSLVHRYCLFFISVLTEELIEWTNFVTLPIFTKTDFEDTVVLIPPLQEQERIVEYLDEQTAIIDSTITKEEKRIELLKEYRQALISEVVTGKVKVA